MNPHFLDLILAVFFFFYLQTYEKVEYKVICRIAQELICSDELTPVICNSVSPY